MPHDDHDFQQVLHREPSTFPFIAVIISVSSERRQVTEVISNDTEFGIRGIPIAFFNHVARPSSQERIGWWLIH